eukprot:Phypoly_transcript_03049.p1 GENE.Phypoly_transcript_03049~~Phypoly_transcript_03049.p1  ORF type:complete len:777 (+),score=52.33 Phypoly_transcript_03049:88-2331(+)
MACNRYLYCGSLLFKWILLCNLIQCTLSFDLYSKNIYVLYGSDAYNIDDTYPVPFGEMGEVGSRQGSVAFMDLDGNAWIFGGIGSENNYLNDLWKFNGGVWYGMGGQNSEGLYNATGLEGYPASRESPAYWVDAAGDFWIFGGSTYDANLGFLMLNDMWRFNTTANSWTWIYGDTVNGSMIPRSDGPTRRSRSASWTQGTKLYLFGGLQNDSNTTNDLWEFDTQTQIWAVVYPDQLESYTTTDGYPAARYGAAVAPNADGVWIFGGKTKDGLYLSDVWQYTPLSGWRWAGGPSSTNSNGAYPLSLGQPGNPPAREGACSWFDAEGQLWVYGGYRSDANATVYYGDFWRAPLGTGTADFLWEGTSATLEFPPAFNATGGGPGPRAYAAHWQDVGGDLFFYSGITSSGLRNDVWVLDMDDCINNGGCYTNCTNLIAQPYVCTPCPLGMKPEGRTNCTDINECENHNGGCDILTNCTNNFNAPPNCSACPIGYNGTGSQGCTVFDWCTLPVKFGGCDPLVTCNFTIPNTPPICGPCPFGYNGTGDQGCIDFDECSINNGGCDILTNCTNNLGGVAPTCGPCPQPYYTGNGTIGCKDVDECNTINKGGCDPLTTCTNNIGGPPTCGSCPPFFVGSGETGCVDFDECSVNNGGCDKNSVCTNNVGKAPTCGPCVKGFIGNNFCSSAVQSSRGSHSAGLIAGVTIGGFVVLLIMIGLIFHFTKNKSSKSPSSMHLSHSSESAQRFELRALSEA